MMVTIAAKTGFRWFRRNLGDTVACGRKEKQSSVSHCSIRSSLLHMCVYTYKVAEYCDCRHDRVFVGLLICCSQHFEHRRNAVAHLRSLVLRQRYEERDACS